jgi:hypothetical protein
MFAIIQAQRVVPPTAKTALTAKWLGYGDGYHFSRQPLFHLPTGDAANIDSRSATPQTPNIPTSDPCKSFWPTREDFVRE